MFTSTANDAAPLTDPIDIALKDAMSAPAHEGELPSSAPTARTMELDAPAVAALNLLPSKQAGKDVGGANATLLGLLAKGVTPMSRNLLRKWLEAPLLDLDSITARGDYIAAFMSDPRLYGDFYQSHMKGIPDGFKILAKFDAWQVKHTRDENAKVSSDAQEDLIKSMMALYTIAQKFPQMIASWQMYDGAYMQRIEQEAISIGREVIMPELERYKALIETSIDVPATNRHTYRVNPSIHADLVRLDAKIASINASMDQERRSAADKLELSDDQVALKQSKSGGNQMTMRVTRKNEKNLREVSKYLVVQSLKDGVYFTTTQLKDLDKALKEYEAQYTITQGKVVTKTMIVTMSFIDVFSTMLKFIAEWDTYLGIAHAALHAPTIYVRPEILPAGSGVLDIKDARHPCVEAVLQGADFIPNNVDMLEKTSRFQVMTGPNMGGKSTYIRMVGVLLVMAQIGAPLPCSSARVSIVERVLARVGAGDSTQEGMSTFMAEMVEANSIVKQATKNSLVIIDELGRGTSTYDGFGLAWAISEELAVNTQCFTFFATHFAELPALETALSCVKNLHVTADTTDGKITMLYQVHPGASDRSFGVHVATVAAFPAEVVRMAREKAAELELFSGDINTILDPIVSSTAMVDEEKSNGQPPSSSPPRSQASITSSSTTSLTASPSVRGTATSKRVQSSSAASPAEPLVVASTNIFDLLTQSSHKEFIKSDGQVDMEKFAQFVKQCHEKGGHGVAMMDTQ